MNFYYGRQYIDNLDIKSINKVLKNEYLTQGPKVKEFESSITNFFKCKYAAVLSSGTASLHLIATALNWQRGDVIITTPNTFVATANAIEHVGARTDFADIEREFYTIDPSKLEFKIKKNYSNNKKSIIKAVIGVDYAGNPCDWESLSYLSKKYNFQLINDNCHAIGSKYKNLINYASKYALASSHSYHPVKNITTGEGGCVLTNNKKLYKKIISLRSHGVIKGAYWKNDMKALGFNYRMTDLQCALGISQLKKLDIFLSKRRKIADLYFKNFKNCPNIILPKIRKNSEHSFHLFPVLLNLKNINKELIFKKLEKKNICLQVHYKPVHLHTYYKKKYKFNHNDYPVAEDFYKREISMPIYYNLSEKNINYISNVFLEILNKNAK
jgi:UDP-4-amino-4,6-dideoxy-N-acetyl-beta-L-altrosamine transaminase